MQYVIEGNIRSAFVEENGGEGAVVNNLNQGDVMFFPQGLIHYEQNLGCEPATFLAALSNEDPGAVTITTRFFELPSEAIEVKVVRGSGRGAYPMYAVDPYNCSVSAIKETLLLSCNRQRTLVDGV